MVGVMTTAVAKNNHHHLMHFIIIILTRNCFALLQPIVSCDNSSQSNATASILFSECLFFSFVSV